MSVKIKVWVVAAGHDWPGGIAPFGNGRQSQFPVFYTKTEALEWQREQLWNRKGPIRKATLVIEEEKR